MTNPFSESNLGSEGSNSVRLLSRKMSNVSHLVVSMTKLLENLSSTDKIV